jgi:2-methylaconitate cis-trans-isomerase PrpF
MAPAWLFAPEGSCGNAVDVEALPQPAAGRADHALPCTIMRGGTSRGLYFRRDDLAHEREGMLGQLRRAVGSGSARGIDGLGGLDPLANKIAVVARARCGQADLDYWFAQVSDLQRGRLDDSLSCGNLLAGVGPFAVESGLVPANTPSTCLRVRSVNTGDIVRVVFATRDGRPVYDGSCAIDGVPGTGSPIELDYATAPPRAERELFPAGHRLGRAGAIEYTLVRCATTLLIARACDFGLSGAEPAQTLNEDQALLRRIETFRREAARRDGLGDVAGSVSPKVALIASGPEHATLCSRYFIPQACHAAHAVTGALALAAAARCAGTLASGMAPACGSDDRLRIAHPAGVLDVHVRVRETPGLIDLQRLSVLRTARRIMRGELWLSDPPRLEPAGRS